MYIDRPQKSDRSKKSKTLVKYIKSKYSGSRSLEFEKKIRETCGLCGSGSKVTLNSGFRGQFECRLRTLPQKALFRLSTKYCSENLRAYFMWTLFMFWTHPFTRLAQCGVRIILSWEYKRRLRRWIAFSAIAACVIVRFTIRKMPFSSQNVESHQSSPSENQK